MGRRRGIETIAALLAGVAIGVGSYLFLPVGNPGAGGSMVEVAGAVQVRTSMVPAELDRLAREAVVLVEAEGCGERRQASATLVRTGSGRVLLLTNAHVVRGSGTSTVTGPDGREVSVSVLGALDGRDVALLDAEPLRAAAPEVVPLPVGPDAVQDATVAVVGHPAAVRRVDSTSVESVEERSAFGSTTDVLILGSQVTGGSSGGAVLDDGGSAVGLVAARDPDTGRAVAYPLSEVLDRALVGIPGC